MNPKPPILWRYLFQMLTVSLMALLFIFTLIITVWDLSERLSVFHSEGISVLEALTEYYVYFTPFFLILIFPFLVFLSVLFTISRLAQRLEIIALYNGGISFGQILVPVMLWTLFWAGVETGLVHQIQPQIARKKIAFERERLQWYFSTAREVVLRLQDTTYLWIGEYQPATSVGYEVYVDRFDRSGNLKERLYALRIRWDSLQHTWWFYQVRWWIRNPESDLPRMYQITRIDSMMVRMGLSPQDLHVESYVLDELTTGELIARLDLEKARGSGMIEEMEARLHERLTSPVLMVLLVLLAVRLASRKTRGGTGWHLALGLLLGFFYIFLTRVSTMIALQSPWIPAWAGVWFPVLVYLFLIFPVYRMVRQ